MIYTKFLITRTEESFIITQDYNGFIQRKEEKKTIEEAEKTRRDFINDFWK